MFFHLPETVLGDLRTMLRLLTEIDGKLDAQGAAIALVQQNQVTQGLALQRLESTQADQSAVLARIERLVGNTDAVGFRMEYRLNP